MTLLKIIIDNRNYLNWEIVNATTFEPISKPDDNDSEDFNPLSHKLFNNDIFTLNKSKVNIVHSIQRDTECIAGVLILSENKTYGKLKNKFLYRCIPDDIRIPPFLIPYEIKHMGFSKMFINLYVTFRFVDWNSKHPIGSLQQVIGSVDILENFYEYQLYCKSLNNSIQRFHKDTHKFLQQKNEDHDNIIQLIHKCYPLLETRGIDWNIFSIDPVNSVDFDDAFSIKTINEKQVLLSIYISNVTIWIDYLNLWKSFSKRISTIYLPDKKRPMLPTILSDCLCSLQENKNRIAFVLDLIIENNIIVSFKFSNCIIRVKKNYIYEQDTLLKMADYSSILHYAKQLSRNYKYLNKINDSHEVVSYFMILMNYYCAKDLLKFNNGIFRSTTMKQQINIPSGLPEEVSQFITIWNSFSGQYIDVSKAEKMDSIRHSLLNMDAYVHITSPIRRLVDLLNMIQMQINHKMIALSQDAEDFYNMWIQELEYINTTMRSIRKVQNDCVLLDLCSKDPDIMTKKYEGYCLDKISRSDGLYQFIVYLPEIKLTSRIIIRENLNNYDKHIFRLFLFHNEEKFKKKIRMQLIE
jgi:exoribonuclease R